MAEDLQARIVELEARYTVQQDLLEQLSEVLYAQQRELDNLAARYKELKERLTSLDAGPREIPPADEVPPHY